MGAFGDVLPDAAKKLYPEPVFFTIARRKVSAAFSESTEGFWRTIEASWVGRA